MLIFSYILIIFTMIMEVKSSILNEEVFEAVLKFLNKNYLIYKPYVFLAGHKMFSTYEIAIELQKKIPNELVELEQLKQEGDKQGELEKIKDIKEKVEEFLKTSFQLKTLEVSSLELQLRKPIFKYTLINILNNEKNGYLLSKNLVSMEDFFKIKNHIRVKKDFLDLIFYNQDFNSSFVKMVIEQIKTTEKIDLFDEKLQKTKQNIMDIIKDYINSLKIL